jgi:hypothetical protein
MRKQTTGPTVEELPDDYVDDNNGGPGIKPIKESKTSQTVLQERHSAKQQLFKLISSSKAKTESITKIIDEANEALHTFGHGNLVKQIEEQNKQLQTDIMAEANIQVEKDKKKFSDAVQNYLNKRLELARVRLQELNQHDKESSDAARYVISTLDTPEGIRNLAAQEQDQKKQSEMLNKVLSELGNKHNHVTRTEGSLFPTKHTVTCNNGHYTSESPFDLAMVVKAKGINEFQFDTGSTKNGGHILRESIKEMLKAGIKDISLSNELREKMYTPRRANNFADSVMEGRRTLNYFQMNELRQLERICDASRSAYNDIKENPVFDKEGDLKPGDEPAAPIVHQVNTFLRLTDDDDRKAYLEILFPVNKAQYYVEFTTELELRKPTITLDGLTPKQYFEKKMMWAWSRNSFRTEHDQQEKLVTFNKDTTTAAERKKSYLETNDATLLRQYARSDKLDTDTRKDFIQAVFDDIQKGERKISLYTHPLVQTRYVTGDDMKRFINKTLPLFTNMAVKGAEDRVDFVATAEEKSALLAELRRQTSAKYSLEKDDDQITSAFDNFYTNKMLLDELEQKILDNHFEQQVEAEGLNTEALQAPKRRELLIQHFSAYQKLGNAERATYFADNLSPGLQKMLWNSMSPNDADTAEVKAGKLELRAMIVKKFMDHHNDTDSKAGADFLTKYLSPLMQSLSAEETTDLTKKLKTLLQRNDIIGCNRKQNRALNIVRNMMSNEKAAELSSAGLFKEYYLLTNDSSNNNAQFNPKVQAEKLLERISCYISGKPANLLQSWAFNSKFDAEMGDLLFPGNAENPQIDAILTSLREDLEVKKDSPEDKYIGRIEQLQANRAEEISDSKRSHTDSFHYSEEVDSDSQSVEMDSMDDHRSPLSVAN